MDDAAGHWKEETSIYNARLCKVAGIAQPQPAQMKAAPRPTNAEVGDPEPWIPLTAEQARQLRERQPSLSPWQVVVVQLAVGLLVALLFWAVSGTRELALSAGYGALAVVIPGAVFARGLTGRLASTGPGAAAVGFMVWEMVKLVLTMAMLVAAPGLVQGLSWPAMLVGLVLTMKVYLVALLWAPRQRK